MTPWHSRHIRAINAKLSNILILFAMSFKKVSRNSVFMSSYGNDIGIGSPHYGRPWLLRSKNIKNIILRRNILAGGTSITSDFSRTDVCNLPFLYKE